MADEIIAGQFVNKAQDLVGQEQYVAAISCFESAILNMTTDSDKAAAFNNIGLCYLKLGNFDEAKIYFNVAISKNQNYALPFFNRAVLFHDLGDLESALKDYDCAIKLWPGYASAHNEKGRCLAQQDNLEEALACFKTAVRIMPNEQSFLGNAGKMYLLIGNPSNAIFYFIKQASAAPSLSEPYVNISQCYRVLGNVMAAINSAELAIKLDANNASAHEEMGLLMCELKQYSHAVIDFFKALKISKNPDIVEHLVVTAGKSEQFKLIQKDCLLERGGEITIFELLRRISPSIEGFIAKK